MSGRGVDLQSLLRDLDEAVREHPLVESDEAADDLGEKFLLVRDGPGAIGFRLEQIAGVVARPRCGRLPRSPRWLVGVFFWEGKMVPLLDWAVLSAQLPRETVDESAERDEPVDRAVILRLQELVFAVAVNDIVGVRRLRLVDGEVERSSDRSGGNGADVLGSRFSSVLRWQQESTEPEPQDARTEKLPVETEVRVVSAMGLLAHRSIARFANPGLIESLFVLDSLDPLPVDGAPEVGGEV